MTAPLGTGMTRRQLEALFKQHDTKVCLKSPSRISHCRICTALNQQFISALREIMGWPPLFGSGDSGRWHYDEERFADFGGADVGPFQAMEFGCNAYGRRLRSAIG